MLVLIFTAARRLIGFDNAHGIYAPGAAASFASWHGLFNSWCVHVVKNNVRKTALAFNMFSIFIESLSFRLWGNGLKIYGVIVSRKLVEIAFIFYRLIGLRGVELDLRRLQANKLSCGEAVFDRDAVR